MLWQVKFIHYIIIILLMRARAFRSNVDNDDDDDDGGGSFLRSFNSFNIHMYIYSLFRSAHFTQSRRYAAQTHHNVKMEFTRLVYGYCSRERNESKTTTKISFFYINSVVLHIIIIVFVVWRRLARLSSWFICISNFYPFIRCSPLAPASTRVSHGIGWYCISWWSFNLTYLWNGNVGHCT